MITLVLGGSGSGKSEYAEHCCDGKYRSKYYIATMQPFDDEMKKKIKRHQEMRSEKGFTTIEKYHDLSEIGSMEIEKDSVILLECMSNLLANEYFGERKEEEEIVDRIVREVVALASLCRDLVIVTNDVFSSGEKYEEETMKYIRKLGKINTRLAKEATCVVEVVCGIPVMVKGEVE